MRVWTAVLMAASVMAGSTIDQRLDGTASDGNRRSWTEKTQISIMPSQKAGMEMPTRASTVTTMSVFEYWRVAEMMPKGIAMTTDRNSASERQQHRVGKALQDRAEDGAVGDVGAAEVEHEQALVVEGVPRPVVTEQEVVVLHDERAIQAHGALERGHLLVLGVLRQQHAGRVAW